MFTVYLHSEDPADPSGSATPDPPPDGLGSDPGADSGAAGTTSAPPGSTPSDGVPEDPTAGVVDRVRRHPPKDLTVEGGGFSFVGMTVVRSSLTRDDGTTADYLLVMDDRLPPSLGIAGVVRRAEEVAVALLDLRARAGTQVEQVRYVNLFVTAGDVERLREARDREEDLEEVATHLPAVLTVLGVLRDAGHRFASAAVDPDEIERILDMPPAESPRARVGDLLRAWGGSGDLGTGGHAITVELQSEGPTEAPESPDPLPSPDAPDSDPGS